MMTTTPLANYTTINESDNITYTKSKYSNTKCDRYYTGSILFAILSGLTLICVGGYYTYTIINNFDSNVSVISDNMYAICSKLSTINNSNVTCIAP